MVIKENKHPLFLSKFRNLGSTWLSRLVNQYLSIEGTCYYIAEAGIKTRIFIYNYFAFLNGAPFQVKWILRAYSEDGKRYEEIKGELTQSQTATIEMAPIVQKLGPIGLCMVHMRPHEGAQTPNTSYVTTFYSEYYTATSGALIHSLGHTVPKLHKVNDYVTSSIHKESEAILLISNSCYRKIRYPNTLNIKGARLEIRNARGETRGHDIEPILPLACKKLVLRKIWPDLDTFLDGKPALFKICGPNVLYSPLLIQTNANGAIATDHFQALNWEEYDAEYINC